MPAPFYPAIKGTTSGAPGTGAFTPNAAASGFEPWSGVPVGWAGMVRYEDGSAWELQYSYWNGTTLSRASTQFIASSTGSVLSLTSSATAALIIDPNEVMSHVGGTRWLGWGAGTSAGPNAVGTSATATGTAANGTIANTNFLTEQLRNQYTSATTANAQGGASLGTPIAVVSTSAGHGGFEIVTRFGASQQPTGPRLFAGMTSATYVGSSSEPSAFTSHVAAFAKDSTDTNIQLLVNSNTATGTKIDTGIPLTTNGWYEASVWCEPGSNKVYGLLIRLDTGDIWFGSTTTNVPGNGATLFPQVLGGLSATTGTAIIMNIGSVFVRVGN